MRIQQNDSRLIDVTKERLAVSKIEKSLKTFPMVILSGPRKVGKTTALLQIALKNDNHVYIDCTKEDDKAVLEKLFFAETNDVLLLIDEVHSLYDCSTWIYCLYSRAQKNEKFRVVITGSVTACTEILSHESAGGGRSGYVHMPVLTYIEYLYFLGKIDRYSTDLYHLDYGDSFYDYMRLKDMDHFNIGPVDNKHIDMLAREMSIALINTRTPNTTLKCTSEDIRNAFILLSYKMAQDIDLVGTLEQPVIGKLDLEIPTVGKLRLEGLETFSVLDAANKLMDDRDIVRAIRYLLWSGLVLYDYSVTSISESANTDLTKLYLHEEGIYSRKFLEGFFSINSRLAVVNPIIYFALSDEFVDMLRAIIAGREQSSLTDLELFIAKKLVNRNRDFLKSGNVLGSWVECYLRGSLALMYPYLPLRCKRFRDERGREVDLVDDVRRVLIEVTVKKRNKTEKEVNFHHFRKYNESCILVTRNTLDVRTMNGIPVLLVPYPMMAAFLDRGEFPSIDGAKMVG